MRVGNHVIYKGKDYRGSIRDDNKVRIISDDPEDEKNGFIHLKFLKCYEKIVDIEEVSECYEVIEMCDYMGETFEPLGIKDDIVVLYASDSKYLDKGFVAEGRDGYIKELKRSEVVIRQVKRDDLLLFRIEKNIRERITDNTEVNDFSFGELDRSFGCGMKGCFFYNGRYYVYSKKEGYDVIGSMNEQAISFVGPKMDIIGPFNGQDLLYACVKLLGKEELFKGCEFSQEAERIYRDNIYHSTKEMEKAAYLIEHSSK